MPRLAARVARPAAATAGDPDRPAAGPPAYLPGLSAADRLASLPEDSDAAKRLVTDLVRGRNTLLYALRQACERAERFLAAEVDSAAAS